MQYNTEKMDTTAKNRALNARFFGKALTFSAAAAAIVVVSLDITQGGRIKFVDGKCHMFEHFARIVRRRRNTFFFGNGIFRSVNEILCGAFDTYDGEKAEGNGKNFFFRLMAESAADAIAYDFGKIVHTAGAASAAIADIHDLCIQNDGIHNFEYGSRKIRSGNFRGIAAAKALGVGDAFENIYVAFAAVKNDLLFHNGNAFDFLRSAKTSAYFAHDLDIHGNADLIKTAVEGNVVYMYVRTEDLRTFRADATASFNQFVSHIRKINDNVFKAILIPTAVKDSVGVYIYRVTGTAAIGRSVSVIRHNDNHSFHNKIRFANGGLQNGICKEII